jgi:Family of unknown function (DUF5946)
VPCPQCGASGDCRAAFDALLAIEFDDLDTFARVHPLTVACWILQHPAGHAAEALALWRAIAADALDARATPDELLARMRHHLESASTSLSAASLSDASRPDASPPAWWPTRWPIRAPDVLPPSGEIVTADAHAAHVRRWAHAVRATIDAADPAFLV